MTDKERAEMQAEIDRLSLRACAAEGAQYAALNLIADIRAAAGDPAGKLMQSELVAHIAGLLADSERLSALHNNSWDLCCFDIPTGQGDADIGWQVVSHHIDSPKEREIAVVYEDSPRAAIDAARNAK